MMLIHVGKTLLVAALFGSLLLPVVSGTVSGAAGLTSQLRQVAPLRQDSVRVPSAADLPQEVPPASVASAPAQMPDGMEAAPGAYMPPVGGYDPAGRRDPFAPLLSQLGPGQVDSTLPPLQRVGLTDMNLIAIIWGAYGYTAMVQTPDGNGYSVRKGTRVGPNSGVVSAVTEKGIIVQERFTDVYGRKQEREYVKLLHPKEGLE
jgi:type IV pilus assembly protein PilP